MQCYRNSVLYGEFSIAVLTTNRLIVDAIVSVMSDHSTATLKVAVTSRVMRRRLFTCQPNKLLLDLLLRVAARTNQ